MDASLTSLLSARSSTLSSPAAPLAEQPDRSRVPASLGNLRKGWPLHCLLLCVLIGLAAWVTLIHWVSSPLQVDAHWQRGEYGQVVLASTSIPALKPFVGYALIGMSADGPARPLVTPDARALQRSLRWLVRDETRERHLQMHEQLAQVIGQPYIELLFDNGGIVHVQARSLGWTELPTLFWLINLLALVLYVVTCAVFLAKPGRLNTLYAVMSLCQAGNLILISIESSLRLGVPIDIVRHDPQIRMALDLITAASIFHASCIHPHALRRGGWVKWLAWVGVAVLITLHQVKQLPHAWWWVQSTCALLSVCTAIALTLSYRAAPHPFAVVLRRFVVIGLGTWLLLTAAVATSSPLSELRLDIANIGATIWYVFLVSLLLLAPFLSKSQQVIREFALLAAVSTVATSLNLLFVATFSLGQFASFTLALFMSIGMYIGSRQWLVHQLLGSSVPSAERMFERLYRVAREAEEHPERTPRLLSVLLQELFEPLELHVIDKFSIGTRVVGDGSTLLLPVPVLGDGQGEEKGGQSILMRFAHRGRRLFTSEDARLTDRIIEQLCRAVAFDRAVEQGRNEERLRLAQDLHDDIGARLLTLMYTAPSPEIEEYARHTLQDLKTLTRGLAASNHRLSHAAAEWKADLTQRLNAAHIELDWKCEFDADTQLNVVQWSGLTRILRELINNVIAHAKARRVDVHFRLFNDRMELHVTDNGHGRDPHSWSHGLGLGGIRKRAKQLGAEVEWQEVEPRGISCRVVSHRWSQRQ